MLIPQTLKRRLAPLPQWLPVGLESQVDDVGLRYQTVTSSYDVTHRCVIAALRPLRIAIGFDGPTDIAATGELQLWDRELPYSIGTLRLRHVDSWDAAGVRLALFEVSSATQRCLRWPHRAWNRWLQSRSIRRGNKPGNFYMPPRDVERTMIFYIRPRPVVLVSVAGEGHSNIFPMDLIGPVSAERFSLALRTTSQSIETMKSTRRIAISDVIARDYQIAYRLGAHHKRMQIDWASLPFSIARSARFALPVPASAPRVRELEILAHREVGSHTWFIARIVTDRRTSDGPRFCHTCGLHQYLRQRHHRALPSAVDTA